MEKYQQTNVHSMTGFGRSQMANEKVIATIEVKTLNNKYLEMRPRLPKALSAWEPVLRQKVSESLKRGTVEVAVSYQVIDPKLIHPINEPTLKAYAIAIAEVSNRLNIQSGLNLTALLRLPGALAIDDNMAIDDSEKMALYQMLDRTLQDALNQLLDMRRMEGAAIQEVLKREIAQVRSNENAIRSLTQEINQRVYSRMRDRISVLIKESLLQIDESRFLQEIAYYTDRSDITEELDRLDSHAKQVLIILESKMNFVVGKRLDFLVQEMLREANTIGSKCDDLRVTNLVVELKLAIDRIREQVQNLE